MGATVQQPPPVRMAEGVRHSLTADPDISSPHSTVKLCIRRKTQKRMWLRSPIGVLSSSAANSTSLSGVDGAGGVGGIGGNTC